MTPEGEYNYGYQMGQDKASFDPETEGWPVRQHAEGLRRGSPELGINYVRGYIDGYNAYWRPPTEENES